MSKKITPTQYAKTISKTLGDGTEAKTKKQREAMKFAADTAISVDFKNWEAFEKACEGDAKAQSMTKTYGMRCIAPLVDDIITKGAAEFANKDDGHLNVNAEQNTFDKICTQLKREEITSVDGAIVAARKKMSDKAALALTWAEVQKKLLAPFNSTTKAGKALRVQCGDAAVEEVFQAITALGEVLVEPVTTEDDAPDVSATLTNVQGADPMAAAIAGINALALSPQEKASAIMGLMTK